MGQEVILYKLKEKKTFLSKIAKKCCFPGKIRQEFYLDSAAEEYDGLESEKEFHFRKLSSKAKTLWGYFCWNRKSYSSFSRFLPGLVVVIFIY